MKIVMDYFIAIADPARLEGCVISRFPAAMVPIYQPAEGIPLGALYPQPLDFVMASDRGGKAVFDCIHNTLGYFIVSAELRDVLEQECPTAIEFLPINLINHKGRRDKRDFFIANVLGTVDCVDLDKSDYVEDAMTSGEFLYLDKLVVDEPRIPANRNIFRIASMPSIVLVRDDLASTLRQSGVDGLGLLPLDTPLDI